MKKANKIVYITLAALLVATIVLALLNGMDAQLKRALEENREFLITLDGDTAATVGLQDLIELEPQEFTTMLASSIGVPREVTLKGVELRSILQALAPKALEAQSFIFLGLDGYYSPLTSAEVYEAEKIYVCFSMDGEIMKSQSEGGYGPFLMVIRGSRFAQRWCKYVGELRVEN